MNPTVPDLDSDPIPGPTPRPRRLAAADLALQSSIVGKIIQFLGGPPEAAFGVFTALTLASSAGAVCSLALRRSRHPVSP